MVNFIVSPCILIHKIYFTPTNALLSYKDVLVHKINIKTS